MRLARKRGVRKLLPSREIAPLRRGAERDLGFAVFVRRACAWLTSTAVRLATWKFGNDEPTAMLEEARASRIASGAAFALGKVIPDVP